jgi:phage regulator Rha-like protein
MSEIALTEEVIISKIYLIRNAKVMIDRDLAELLGVETRVLKQAVRRNINRFPEDFMFAMSKEEMESWRSQHVTSKADRQGLRYAPFCFTEQGVTMLSCILNSDVAIKVNIRIIRVFTKMREMVMTHKDILLKVEQMEKTVAGQDEKIAAIFDYLKQFIKEQETPRPRIGFKPS